MTEEEPVWVVYRHTTESEPFALLTTTKKVWDVMQDRKRAKGFEIVAEGLTYEGALKMIGLTKGE